MSLIKRYGSLCFISALLHAGLAFWLTPKKTTPRKKIPITKVSFRPSPPAPKKPAVGGKAPAASGKAAQKPPKKQQKGFKEGLKNYFQDYAKEQFAHAEQEAKRFQTTTERSQTIDYQHLPDLNRIAESIHFYLTVPAGYSRLRSFGRVRAFIDPRPPYLLTRVKGDAYLGVLLQNAFEMARKDQEFQDLLRPFADQLLPLDFSFRVGRRTAMEQELSPAYGDQGHLYIKIVYSDPGECPSEREANCQAQLKALKVHSLYRFLERQGG